MTTASSRPIAGAARAAFGARAGARKGGSELSIAAKALSGVAVAGFALSPLVGFDNVVVALSIVGVLAVIGFLRAPELGMLGIVWLVVLDVPFRVYVLTRFELPYNTINYVLLAVGVFSLPGIVRSNSAPAKWLLVFIIVATLQLLPSSNYELGMVVILELVAGLALMGAIIRWADNDEVLYWLAILTATTSGACLLAYLSSKPEELLNSNALGHVALAGLAMVAVASARAGVIRNWTIVETLAMINVALLFFTESRASFVLGSALGIFVILRSPSVMHKALAVATFACLFIWAAATFVTAAGSTADKWARFMDPDVTLSQASNRRVDLALVGWSIFRDNPLGAGTGSFSDFDDYVLGDNLAHIRRAAHSAWVKTIAENGVPGVLLLSGFVLSYAVARRRGARRVSLGFGALVSLVLALGFVAVEFQSKALWLLAGGATVVLYADRQQLRARAGIRRGLRASVIARPTGGEKR